MKIDERKQPVIKEVITKTKNNTTNSSGPLLKKQSLKSISKDKQQINSYATNNTINGNNTLNQSQHKRCSSFSSTNSTTSSSIIQNKKSSATSLSSALKSNNQYSRGTSNSISEISDISSSIGGDDEWDDDFLADVDLDKVFIILLFLLFFINFIL